MTERDEQGLVQELIAQSSVEALDESVLCRLAGRNVVPFDPALLRPAQHRQTGQLGAVVGDDHGRTATHGDDRLELAHDPQSRQRRVGDQRQAFAREVVDDGEDAEPSPVRERIRQKVHAPALVGTLRDCHWRPRSNRALAAAAAANLQPLLTIEPAELLVVHGNALTREQDVKPPVAKAPANRRQLAQPRPNSRVIRASAAVSHRRPIGPECRTRPPLADLIRGTKVNDGLSPGGGRHHFFDATSFSIALSSIASASSFFSLAFSSSGAFSRLASDTSRPPYLPFHL